MNSDLYNQFVVKNQEILKNKLFIDVDNNIDSLLLSVSNMISFVFEDGKKRIKDILESVYSSDEVNSYIDTIENYSIKEINGVLDYKKKNIVVFLNNVIVSDNIVDDYISKIKNINIEIEGIIDKLFIDLRKVMNTKSSVFSFDAYSKGRFDEFIYVITDSLKYKLQMHLLDRDSSLINNLNESYTKYKHMNESIIEK